ncbi:mechanosensitive ion channel family protein [Thermovibrio ammonificans]|jgi:small conductance mechanosensitive channel|uniref:MscS Mechanosensitive ion channel n=1 Tax=Thermovibrio ammonificans (strain DSM 15698 / JCM 12110 / HB-1) TaxID=648996 RepID=E8T2X5_THEA1|nr:mechanosensitive ion channel domain-containing protein [Thermovibrio ammonificans]ADU97184.1 MscS Mechanosensitive ion channel [Thermovibrio ammonificans HB-1]
MESYISIAVGYAVKILGALAVFIIGRWVVRKLADLLEVALKKADVDETLVKFLGNAAYFLLLILVIIAALGTLGINTTSFAAIVGAVGLAVGLALQNNMSNIGAGVLILFLKPFKVGDFIEAGGVSGTVEALGIVNTTLRTPDNVRIFVPNSSITSGSIKNYSAEPIRRIDLVIGIGYDDDIKKAKEVLYEILNSDPRILKEPAPSVSVAELADSSINLNVRPWVKREDYWAVRSDLLERIKERFDAEGISIPYPQMDVHADVKLLDRKVS